MYFFYHIYYARTQLHLYFHYNCPTYLTKRNVASNMHLIFIYLLILPREQLFRDKLKVFISHFPNVPRNCYDCYYQRAVVHGNNICCCSLQSKVILIHHSWKSHNTKNRQHIFATVFAVIQFVKKELIQPQYQILNKEPRNSSGIFQNSLPRQLTVPPAHEATIRLRVRAERYLNLALLL